jgi:acyl-CoA synthetase (NDP forming)
VLYQVPTLDRNITNVLIELSKKYDKPLLCCSSGGKSTRTIAAVLEANRVPVYSTPDRVAKSFSVLARHAEWLRKK